MKTLGDLKVGDKVKDPFSTYYGVPIVWQVADKNHPGYPANSVTLITERIVTLKCLDAIEPNNSDTNRKQYGNNRYSVSNIKQWLNSSENADNWYTPQHSTDAPPIAKNIQDGYNPYDTKSGFLNKFSPDFRNALLDTSQITVLNTVTDGGDSETVTSKIFLASRTEVGLANENNIAEGSKLALFSDDESREAYPTVQCVLNDNFYGNVSTSEPWHWWLRTPEFDTSYFMYAANGRWGYDSCFPREGDVGVRPLCNLPASTVITDSPDANGNYIITWDNDPTRFDLSDLPVGATVEIPVKAEHQSYLGSNLVWKVADKNHAGYPADSVTMITDKIIAILPFDAKEPNNSNADRKQYGNNRYSVSNIKQWLNSSASAGNWYSPQHSTDAPPTKANVRNGYNFYDTRAGFLAMLDDNFVSSLLNTSQITVKPTADGGGSETVQSKMFLASTTEVGLGIENGIAEGSKLALFSDQEGRIAYPTEAAVASSEFTNSNFISSKPWYWLLRTPRFSDSSDTFSANNYLADSVYVGIAFDGDRGIRPLCNLPASVMVSPTPNANGNYTILAYKTPTTIKDLNVGALVKDPKSTYYDVPVVWQIADQNHAGYPANSTTLVTHKIQTLKCFDAAEPNNSDASRKTHGNNRYSVSNIKQWLNSSASADNWYSPQHSTDAPPIAANVEDGHNPYEAEAGFLNKFSNAFKNALLNTSQITALNKVTDGGGSETVTSKIFLASTTEVGLANQNNIAEGSKLALFSDNESRKAYPTAEAVTNSTFKTNLSTFLNWLWSLRTPFITDSYSMRRASDAGTLTSSNAFISINGIRPFCNIPNTSKVSSVPDADGAFVLLLNSPPTAPESITVPEVISGGTNATISWGASTDPDGNLSGYKLERKVNDGSFEQIYSGSARSFSTTITWGWESVTFRVKAYDADGEESAYTTSPTRTIINNATPVISGEDADLGTLVTGFPAQSYTVTDTENDTVTVTVKLDETVLKTFTAVLGDEYTVSLSDEQWTKILNGSHTVKILATDGTTTATRTFTFAKNVTFVELETDPLQTDAPAAVAIINIVGAFPEGSILTVEVANNGFDESPTWIDATEKVLAGEKIYIGNTDKTAENWGVKLHVKLERGTATGDCYINSIGGNFA